MLALELGFLQGFRLLGRDPEAPSATPERRFLILNLAAVRGPKVQGPSRPVANTLHFFLLTSG